MTEHEWLTGTDSEPLIEYWGDRFTVRKAHLLMLACCRANERFFAHDAVREAVGAIAAHFADPLVPDAPFEGEHLRDLYHRVEEHADDQLEGPVRGVAFGVLAAVEPRSIAAQLSESLRYLVRSCFMDIANNMEDDFPGERAAQSLLVREVLGNPFRPVAGKPEWRTDTVLALARQMYVAEEFSAMPILADALQDAGCDNDDLLNHCRHETLHVRGCWALDLIFGKE